MFARTSRDPEQQLFKNNEWALIDDLIQSIFLVNNGLASREFTSNVLNRLTETADEQAIEILMAKGKFLAFKPYHFPVI